MSYRNALIPLIALTACGGPEPGLVGQFGEDEDTLCVEISTTPVAPGDTVTVGYEGGQVVVQDVLDLATGTWDAELTWRADDQTTTVTFTSQSDASTAVLVHSEPIDDEIPASACYDQLRFDVQGTLVSADGRLDEAIASSGTGSGEGVSVSASIDDPSGSVDPVAMSVAPEPVQADRIAISILLQDGLGPFQGSVSPVRSDVPGDDVQPLGSWPGELEEEE